MHLRQSLIRRVFQTKAFPPWGGNKSNGIQVCMCLLNERSWYVVWWICQMPSFTKFHWQSTLVASYSPLSVDRILPSSPWSNRPRNRPPLPASRTLWETAGWLVWVCLRFWLYCFTWTMVSNVFSTHTPSCSWQKGDRPDNGDVEPRSKMAWYHWHWNPLLQEDFCQSASCSSHPDGCVSHVGRDITAMAPTPPSSVESWPQLLECWASRGSAYSEPAKPAGKDVKDSVLPLSYWQEWLYCRISEFCGWERRGGPHTPDRL